MLKNKSLIAVIEKDEMGNFVGTVPSLRSCYTQAKTLPELEKRLKEVIKLSLEVEKKFFKKEFKLNTFVGIQTLELA